MQLFLTVKKKKEDNKLKKINYLENSFKNKINK